MFYAEQAVTNGGWTSWIKNVRRLHHTEL